MKSDYLNSFDQKLEKPLKSRNASVSGTQEIKRVIHKIDSESRSSSYLNVSKSLHKHRVSEVIHGMS